MIALPCPAFLTLKIGSTARMINNLMDTGKWAYGVALAG